MFEHNSPACSQMKLVQNKSAFQIEMTDIITSWTREEKHNATYCTIRPKSERPTVTWENDMQSKYKENTDLFLLCI